MKKFFIIVFTSLLFLSGYAQPLTGTKTIKVSGGDYSTFTSAIAALNTYGVGIGGVTFNVDAGFIDSASNLIISDSTATSKSKIIFQKAGNGNNPLIIAKSGTGNLDGIIKFVGTSYITFDKIDLIESSTNATANSRMEWGFALLKPSAKRGCNNIIIKNCHITLNKANTNTTYGIYSANHTTTSTTDLTLKDSNGCNSHNRFFSDSISNVFGGICIKGYNASVSSPVYDQDNKVGFEGGNYITNFSGSGNTTEAAILGSSQNNMVIANNIINGGIGTTAPVYGINTSNGTNCNIDIYNNTITLSSATTGFNASMAGISNSIGNSGTKNTVNIYNNHIQNCKYTGTSGLAFYGINNTGGAFTVNVYNNIINTDTIGGTGNFNGIAVSAGITVNVHDNHVLNNRRSGTTTGATYCFSISSGTIDFYHNTAHDNSIAAGTGSLYGYYNNVSSLSSESIYGNKIYNLTHAGSGNVYGIQTQTNVTVNKQLMNDTIYALSSAGGAIYGIYTANGVEARIYKNHIFNLSSTTPTGVAYGINSFSGTAVYIYNNLISDLKTPADTSNNAINGIYINNGTGTNVYVTFNTVYLNATSTSTKNFGTNAIFVSSTPTVDLRNNIFVNTSIPGPVAGKTSAYRRSSTTLTSYAALSNNNCFYAGTPSSRRVIFYDGTNYDSTITGFQNRLVNRDASSFSENPPFINVTTAPYNLHLSTTVPTACESGGAPFATSFKITDDFDGDIRDTISPDVGADEGNFILLDKIPPVCSYQQLANTSSLTARTLTATITDPSNVPTTGNGMPVLRWKKNLSGSWTAASSSYTGNNKYDFILGSGVAAGDTVYYYVLAQDSATPPNVGSYPSSGASGFTANPPAVSKPPTNPYYYVIIAGFPGGNYKIGGTGNTPATGCTYVDLTAALKDISGREITGPINLLLTKNYSSAEEDTFPLLVKPVLGQDATNTITIKPDTNVITSISRLSTTSIFKFDGAKYFTIDGSNNGTSSRDLTITNTSTSNYTATIWIGSQGIGKGTSYVTLKNCSINAGSNTAVTYGIYIGNATTITDNISAGGADNDNITIDNNQITKCVYGIYLIATSSGIDDNLIISNNIIGSSVAGNSIGNYGIDLYSYVNNATIIKNEIFGLTTTGSNAYGIYIGNGITNSKFSKNKIHDIMSTGTGTINGISVNSSTGANLVFDNNILHSIISINRDYGFYVALGGGYSFYYNSVYLSGDRDALGTNKATNPSYAFYSSGDPTSMTLKNNIFVNSQLAATNPTTAKSFAIYNNITTATYSSINYNDYYVSGAQGVLAYQGADITTLSGWQTATTKDVNSISADPQFNSPSNLEPGISSAVLAAGTPITGITTDINGTIRNVTNPSIGAYETGSDVTGPAITYTAFTNTTSTTARTLTATITDPSGVPTSGSGLPVLYWKINTGVWTPITAVSIGSNQYTFTFGSGVTGGDNVFYYIAAQDNFTTINVSVFPTTGASGFTANPPAVSTPPTSPNTYHIITAIPAGNYDIGGSGTTPCGTCTYVDLTAAFNDIYNYREITGPIKLNLTSFYKSKEEDAFPITINPLPGASATNTVTIKPASGTTDTITGNSTSSIIRLYGGDYIIIDGSNNGTTSRDLVIQNTSTSSARAAIQISSRGVNNGATFNTIKNTIIMAGNNTATNYGISIGNTIGGSGEDNDNIQILNNQFFKAIYGIYAIGTTTGIQDNLTIKDNVFGDTALANSIGRYDIFISQNNGFSIDNNIITNSNTTGTISACIYLNQSSGGIVSNNSISNIRSSTNSVAGIYVGTGVVNSKITANLISGIKYINAAQNGGGKGIDINTANLTSNILIANNMVSGISGSGTGNFNTNAIVGIRILGNTGGVSIYHNSVNLSGKTSHIGTTVCKNSALYLGSGVTALDIRNNIFSSSILDTSGTNTSYAIYSDAPTGSFTNLNYNNYYVSDSQGVLGYINLANDSSLSALKLATGQDSNSLNVNPNFVSDVDLHVSSAYLNNTGDTISMVTDDIDRDTRNVNQPDIGADEFGLKAVVTTLKADQISGSKATVWGKVNPMNEYNTVVTFDYGTTTAYGSSVTAIQSPLQGMKDTTVNANLTGLLLNTTYHYRIVSTTSAGISYGSDSTFKSAVGIKENQSYKEAIVYMNGKNLIIQLDREVTDAQVMVYDLFGKEILSGKMTGMNIQLDLGNSATGYYLVSIISDQMVLNKKVFVK